MNEIEALLNSCPEGAKEVFRAQLRVQVSEVLLDLMEQQGTTKSEIARKIGVSRSAVTQALNGSRNMTLNLLADIAEALEVKPTLQFNRKPAVDAKFASAAVKAFHVRAGFGVITASVGGAKAAQATVVTA
jgi:antitoxin component HigA of HigAB toxin-antitoxin module